MYDFKNKREEGNKAVPLRNVIYYRNFFSIFVFLFLFIFSLSLISASTDLIPDMTSNTAPSGEASAKSSYTSYLPWKAMDDDLIGLSDSWVTAGGGGPTWIQYKFDSSKIVDEYKIYTRDTGDTTGRKPRNWVFEASNDNLTWTTLDTQTDQFDVTATPVNALYSSGNTFNYTHYRLNISLNWGDSYTSLQEIEFFEYVDDNKAQQDLWDGAVNIYHLNGDTIDAKGNNVATSIGATYNATGKLGGMYSFDGSDYITTTPLNGVSGRNYSIAMWIKTTDTQGELLCNFETGSPYRGFSLAMGSTDVGKLQFYSANASVGGWSTDTTNINDGTWKFVVMSFNSTGANFFRNGSFSSTQSVPQETGVSTNNGSIGADCNGARGRYLIGNLDEIMVFNRTLTQAEIDWLYNSGAGRELTEPVGGGESSNSNVQSIFAEDVIYVKLGSYLDFK